MEEGEQAEARGKQSAWKQRQGDLVELNKSREEEDLQLITLHPAQQPQPGAGPRARGRPRAKGAAWAAGARKPCPEEHHHWQTPVHPEHLEHLGWSISKGSVCLFWACGA